MTPPSSSTQLPPAVRVLSESEIHDRLYGSYLGKKKTPARSSPSPDSAWTGSEILTGELQRLRSELISLRQEKEKLVVCLERSSLPVPAEKTGSGIGGWIGKMFGFFLLLGVFGYLSGPALQASPSAGDFTPYTVQVAVYNGPVLADQARGFLKELGYDAFTAQMPRMDGKLRYRVYVGSFVTKEEAARESKRLSADTRFQDFKDAFVLIR